MRGNKLQFSDRPLQISNRAVTLVLHISIVLVNSHKKGDFQPKFGFFEENFPTVGKFADRLKFRGRKIAPHPLATTPRTVDEDKGATTNA